MNLWKIALRSLQYRGLGSLLTMLSMALGVMMVVSVLTIHGVVSESFRNNSSFGYNLLLGARGGGLQLTLNSVFYLSRPIDTIPYEYFLAFSSQEKRTAEVRNSIAWRAMEQQQRLALESAARQALPAGGAVMAAMQSLTAGMLVEHQKSIMEIDRRPMFSSYTKYALPILLGDYYEVPRPPGHEDDPAPGPSFRVCGTNADFFRELELDFDTKEKFRFAAGRAFADDDPEAGFYGCVLGAAVARQAGLKLDDELMITHGVPGEESSHLHDDQKFRVLGILEATGTPHDRVVFVNMEGFYLFTDHIAVLRDDSVLNANRQGRPRDPSSMVLDPPTQKLLTTTRLPLEQRELTSILLSTKDEEGLVAMYMQPLLESGDLEKTLAWSSFRPERAQTSVQAVNPIQEITGLFAYYVDPARWLLLGLTILICVVSGLSILVGIYNSMSQRHHEIAVMRALGASRSKVMRIILWEAILLSVAGGVLGWVAGHSLNWAVGSLIENQTGVHLGFWKMAPAVPVFAGLPGSGTLPPLLLQFQVSPELLLIPGLVLLAIAVGIYPAISAYRADVSRSLGK